MFEYCSLMNDERSRAPTADADRAGDRVSWPTGKVSDSKPEYDGGFAADLEIMGCTATGAWFNP